MKKVISYSLFSPNCGNFDKSEIRIKTYTQGVWDNLKLIQEIMPDWKMRVYHNNSIDFSLLPEENSFLEYELVDKNDDNYMFWRFYAWDDPEIDILLSRDLDDRINFYDFQIVKIFESSPSSFCSVRCHEQHDVPILGGMWSSKPRDFTFSMLDLLLKWKSEKNSSENYMSDQYFLANCVWPLVSEKCISFGFYGDRFFSGKHVYLPLDKSAPHQTEAHLGCTYGPQVTDHSRTDSKYEEHPFAASDEFYSKLKNLDLEIEQINEKFFLELGKGLIPEQINK
jgi:hypothetical protein